MGRQSRRFTPFHLIFPPSIKALASCQTVPKSDEIGELWMLFFYGDCGSMAARRCSRCGGLLQWAPRIHSETRERRGVQKHPMGLSIFCRGACKYMIAHLDGLAPDWALGVSGSKSTSLARSGMPALQALAFVCMTTQGLALS